MSFGKKKITGSLREPRVQFARTNIPVTRSDEPVQRDFYSKSLEDLNDFSND